MDGKVKRNTIRGNFKATLKWPEPIHYCSVTLLLLSSFYVQGNGREWAKFRYLNFAPKLGTHDVMNLLRLFSFFFSRSRRIG